MVSSEVSVASNPPPSLAGSLSHNLLTKGTWTQCIHSYKSTFMLKETCYGSFTLAKTPEAVTVSVLALVTSADVA